MNITITTKRNVNGVKQVCSCFYPDTSQTVLASLTAMRGAVNSLHQLDIAAWSGDAGCTVVSQDTTETRKNNVAGTAFDIDFVAERVNSAVGAERITAFLTNVTAMNIATKFAALMATLVTSYTAGDYLIRVANITMR